MKKSARKARTLEGKNGLGVKMRAGCGSEAWLLSGRYVVVSLCSMVVGMMLYPSLEMITTILYLTDPPTARPEKDVESAQLPAENDVHNSMKKFIPTFQKHWTPQEIQVDGRTIKPVQLLPKKEVNTSVRAYIYEDFLSERECDGLITAQASHIAHHSHRSPILCFDGLTTLLKHLRDAGQSHVKVTSQDFSPGTYCLNATFSEQVQDWLHGNWSYSTAFYPGESPFSTIFAQRVYYATGLQEQNGGKFQITSYQQGIGYKTHTDCVMGSSEMRDRYATILVYLKDVQDGGETQFPELGLSVKPRKGQALVWNNMDSEGNCDPTSLHSAMQVITGEKIILQRWYYYESFYLLGQRPREPDLPARAPHQPRVACDQYDQGSCRWYDEWDYDHIVKYSQIKHTLH